jgi:shikimate dehydrogenase
MEDEKKICGIIGNPLFHSLSPKMHNAAFSHLNLDYEYHSFEVSSDELVPTLDSLKLKNFRGLNVTHPYKIRILEHVDVLDESARSIGSVNTIIHEAGKLIGHNTDSQGAIGALKEGHPNIENNRYDILILGAGGAARAVAYPLVKMENNVFVSNRTFEKAEDLARNLEHQGNCSAIELKDLPKIMERMDIIINSTPLGMKGGPLGTIIQKDLITTNMTVFDMVYNPKNTPLLIAAKEQGARIIYGFEMFVRQGALAFELWTQKKAPLSLMRDEVIKALDDEDGGDSIGR